MPLIVRLGDTSDHGGQVISANDRWTCEGPLIARLGDLFDCPVHGVNPIAQGSDIWRCRSQPIARHGDHTSCGAALVSGAVKWTCD